MQYAPIYVRIAWFNMMILYAQFQAERSVSRKIQFNRTALAKLICITWIGCSIAWKTSECRLWNEYECALWFTTLINFRLINLLLSRRQRNSARCCLHVPRLVYACARGWKADTEKDVCYHNVNQQIQTKRICMCIFCLCLCISLFHFCWAWARYYLLAISLPIFSKSLTISLFALHSLRTCLFACTYKSTILGCSMCASHNEANSLYTRERVHGAPPRIAAHTEYERKKMKCTVFPNSKFESRNE